MKKILVASICLIITTGIICGQEVVGIDVSHHQGKIDWNLVGETDIEFAYIKATEGATYTDPNFHSNIKGAIEVGLSVGAYHYFRMTSSATEQFENFKNALSGYAFDLIPMIDVETSDNKPIKQLQDSLNVFIKLVKDEYGCPPMIYGTQRSYNTYCAPKYNNYHLYIGRYGPNAPEIKGTGTYSIWQYTESARVSGVPKSVDMCRFNLKYNLDDFRVLTYRKQQRDQ